MGMKWFVNGEDESTKKFNWKFSISLAFCGYILKKILPASQ